MLIPNLGEGSSCGAFWLPSGVSVDGWGMFGPLLSLSTGGSRSETHPPHEAPFRVQQGQWQV